MTTPRATAAYMEEADDESGQVLHETKVSASVDGHTSREKANSKKSRQSPSPANQTDSDSTTILSPRSRREKDARAGRSKDKDRTSEREKERRDRDRDKEDKSKRPAGRTTVTFEKRPPAKHTKTSPVLHHGGSRRTDEPEYYGVSARQQPAQRPGRSMSYNGGQNHPPRSNAQFYLSQGALTPQHYNYNQQPPPPLPPPPYAPHHMYGGSSYPAPPLPVPDRASLEEAQHRNLKQRFETGPRPASAMGQRPSSKSIYGRDQDDDAIRRRPSLKKRESDRDRMPPPPPRPSTTRPEKIALRPAPPQVHRTRGYEDEDLLSAESGLYREVAAATRRLSGEYHSLQPRRPSVLYVDTSPVHLQPAVTNRPRSRPNSFYGQQLDYAYGPGPMGFPPADGFEEKLRNAEHYQHTAAGFAANAQPLTKDALKRASRKSHGGSSRSTRSSESRDESDYRRSSIPTRTTRSTVPGEDDLTITVPANTTLEVQGTKIQCRDGGEVNISARPGGGGSGSRSSGSDKDSLYDERPTRAERPSFRGRTMSQSSSYSRTMMDPYAYQTNPYFPQTGFPPPPPPPPRGMF